MLFKIYGIDTYDGIWFIEYGEPVSIEKASADAFATFGYGDVIAVKPVL